MKKGFTLIEMAVVLLIIGMLATLVLRGIYGTTPMARDTRRKGDLTNVANYLAQYLSKFGYYPSSTNWEGLQQTLSQAGIVNVLPKDPGGGSYNYYPCSDYSSEQSTIYNHFILRAIFEQTPEQAPKIYEGTITSTPTGWNCYQSGGGQVNIQTVCDISNGNYCIAF